MTTGFYNKYLLFIAGLGGLLYGIDVGVIAGALPYLQATREYTPGQLSTVVAAVLGGSVLSSLFAGGLAEWMGRKWLMILSGICFVLSVPVICLPSDYWCLVAGRVLQGAAAGFIGVVVPLYLAECLPAEKRGFGTGMFQFMLTIGLVFAALIGLGASSHVDAVSAAKGDVFGAMDFAWKAIFWACAVPGVIFTVGAFAISESARWLYKKGNAAAALASLTRSRGAEAAQAELNEMGKAPTTETTSDTANVVKDSLLQKKYVVPFVLAVVILACNQATGVNSVLAYVVDVLRQAGLEGAVANMGDTIVKVLNMVITLFAMLLVDKMGRKALLTIGTSGIIVGLLGVAILFFNAERKLVNQAETLGDVAQYRTLNVEEDEVVAGSKTGKRVKVDYAFVRPFVKEANAIEAGTQIRFVYTLDGEKNMKTLVVRPAPKATPEKLDAEAISKAKAEYAAWLDSVTIKVPYAKTDDGKGYKNTVPFTLEKVNVGPLPSAANGWFVTFFFAVFISAFAIGPGVCVWLALSELMPNRIRSMGMSIALLINQGVSYTIAQFFLPSVANWGYAPIFFFCAGCTVIYWVTAVFFLPETKGRTLEEIEAHFSGKKRLS